MKTTLLTLAALGFAAAANAQLLNYGFESGDVLPGQMVTENWSNYAEGSTFNFEDADAFEGVNALGVTTDKTCATYERVVAFKGIPVEPMKSYRVTFMAKGDAPINVAILEGDFYQDIALQTPNGAQTYDKAIGKGFYQRVSQVIWSPSYEDMCSKYSNDNYPELLHEYFLRLSFNNIGTFKVDNIQIVESSIAGIVFNGNVLGVDFGYATNAKELAAANNGTALLDPSCVTVIANGEEAVVESVEIKSDGQFVIFLTEDYWFDGEANISVSFKNDCGLKYTSAVAPMCFEEPNAAVFSFEGEAAYYDEEFTASSYAWEEAQLVSSDPEDGSFELDNDINTFTFTFNKNVLTYSEENDAPVAILSSGSFSESLVVVPNEEPSPVLVFHRPEGVAPLQNGQYNITLSNVSNERHSATGELAPITIEVGKVVVAETTYTLVADCTFPDAPANGIPAGWVVVSDGETRTEEGSYGSGGRVFDCAAPQKKGIYTRANGGEGSVCSPFFEIPAGEVEIHPLICGWSNNSNITLQLVSETGETVYEDTYNTEIPAENSRNNGDFKFGYKTIFFNHAGGRLQMFVKLNSEGFSGMFVGGVEVYTSVTTDGEKSDAEVLLHETWPSTANNAAPAAGSGWRIYAGGAAKNPGQDYNYNGARIFDLGYKNLNKAFYNGMGGNSETDYIIYGEGEPYVDADGNEIEEPVLKLSNGKVQVTYYCTNWKTDLQHQTIEIIEKASGNIVYTRTDDITPNPGGDRNANIEAQKVQFTFYVPEGGEYLVKFYTDGEGFVGNIDIQTVGSLAVQYKNLLKEALKEAQAELETANGDENYRGTTRDALAKAIEDYTNPDFHTGREYTEAIAHLEQLVKAMSARRANINSFAAGVEALFNGLNAAAGAHEKYTKLDVYAQVTEYYNTYAEVDPVTLEDEELGSAVAVMQKLGNLLKNMVNDCIPFLTQQAVDLASMIVALTPADSTYVIMAAEALTDDQDLVAKLKKQYNGLLYAKLAVENPFSYEEYDPDLDMSYDVTDSIAMPAMVQNRGFYTDAQKQKSGALANENSFPGWNITITQNSILADWGWGGPYNCSEERPISDAAVCTAWGTSDVDVNQTLTNLPVGVYTVSIKVGDGTATSEENLSRAYVKTAAMEEAVEAVVINDQGARNAQPYKLAGITADVDGYVASLTVGAKLMSRGDFSKCDDAELWLTGKLEGFDYAAASAALLQEVSEGIELAERDDQPAVSLFYDLNGRRIQAADGVCIRIDRYEDGMVVVRKVVVK